MNTHYTLRYNNFVTYIKNCNLNRTLLVTHKHHILPRSLGGSDDESNILECSPREHYICHLLLAKSTDTPQMIYAWNMMRKFAKSSRDFDSLLIEKYELLSSKLKGKVSVKHLETQESKFVDVDYARDLVDTGMYKYCGSGFVVVKDDLGDTYTVSVEDYNINKSMYTHINEGKFSVFNTSTNKHEKVTKKDFNQDIHVTNLTDKVCVLINGAKKMITKDEYASGKYVHHCADTMIVKDETGKISRIKKDEITNNHRSIKEGRVNVYFEDGSTGEVTKEEFDNNRSKYRTHNEGLVSVYDIESNKTLQISVEEFKKYKNVKYRHVTAGLKLTCPHCGKTGGNTLKRWHFDNCKSKGV